ALALVLSGILLTRTRAVTLNIDDTLDVVHVHQQCRCSMLITTSAAFCQSMSTTSRLLAVMPEAQKEADFVKGLFEDRSPTFEDFLDSLPKHFLVFAWYYFEVVYKKG